MHLEGHPVGSNEVVARWWTWMWWGVKAKVKGSQI